MSKAFRKTKYAIEINGICFASGESLKRHLREIIDSYLWHSCPDDVSMNDDHASFFIELVRLRDPHRIPAGQYIKDVVRTTREGQVGRHVCFIYGNDQRDMIGWGGLCSARKPLRQAANDALRQAVCKQAARVYAMAFDGTHVDMVSDTGELVIRGGNKICTCPKSGVRLSSTGEFADDVGVVHHDGIPYAEIREAWMAEHGHSHESLPLIERQEGGWGLAPGDVRDSWEAFHAIHADLVVVSKKWHDQHHASERKKSKETSSVIAPTLANG